MQKCQTMLKKWNPNNSSFLLIICLSHCGILLSFQSDQCLCTQIFYGRMLLRFHYKQLCFEQLPDWHFCTIRTDSLVVTAKWPMWWAVYSSVAKLAEGHCFILSEINCNQIRWKNSGIVYISCALLIPITREEFTRWLPSTTQNTWIRQEELIN